MMGSWHLKREGDLTLGFVPPNPRLIALQGCERFGWIHVSYLWQLGFVSLMCAFFFLMEYIIAVNWNSFSERNHARWDWSISEQVWVCFLDCALSLPLMAIVIGRCWIEIGLHWLTEVGSWRLAINAWRTQVELSVATLFQSCIIQLH